MNGIIYFLTETIILQTLLATASFVIGLIFGWLIWGRMRHILYDRERECKDLRIKLASTEKKMKDAWDGNGKVSSPMARVDSAQKDLQAEVDDLRSRLESEKQNTEKEKASLKEEIEKLKHAKEGDTQEAADLVAELGDLKAKISEFETESPEDERARELESELNSAKERIAELEAQGAKSTDLDEGEDALESLKKELEVLREELATSRLELADVEAERQIEPELDKKNESGGEEDEDESQLTVEDMLLGKVFKSRPRRVDSIRKIRGIASIIEDKLNEMGIYRFEQIANLSEAQQKEVEERLLFRDRIDRDNWIEQAKMLHAEKYGESI